MDTGTQRRRPCRRSLSASRQALAWGVLLFFAGQMTVSLLEESRFIVWRDPELGIKTQRLRARLQDLRGRPLVVVLGSSRSAMGVRPDALAELWPAQGEAPVVFNYAILGAGPVTELACLNRLLQEGARPDLLLVEIHPALLYQDQAYAEGQWISAERRGWAEQRVLGQYARGQWLTWVAARMAPVSANRLGILSSLAPCWLPWSTVRQDGWLALDRDGWMVHRKPQRDAADARHDLEAAREQYSWALKRSQVSTPVDRAVRDLLALCRRERVRPVLVTLPEARSYQGWFSASARSAVQAYLTTLCQEADVPWVDARDWMSDDAFYDGHHLTPDGATAFTRRLAGEVIHPALRGGRTSVLTP